MKINTLKFILIREYLLKIKDSWSIASLTVLIFLITTGFRNIPDNLVKPGLNDSTRVNSKVREVFTSQQLFITDIQPLKKGKKGKKVKFKAELRDAFKIIRYDEDSVYTELNWVMCTKYGQPEAGQYTEGTSEYKKLEVLIANVKKNLKN